MIILALDISASCTGVAVGDASVPPHTTSAAFTGATRGAKGAKYAKWLRALLIHYKPALVAAEAPLRGTMIKKKDGTYTQTATKTSALLTGLAFLTETVCATRGVKYVEVHSGSWRKAFLGRGPHPDPKERALKMCAMVGWKTGGEEDRAEACGVFAWAHINHGNRSAMDALLSIAAVRALEK